MAKVHKIASYFYDKRKILNQKFWSHGTPLGSLGPLSQQDTILGAGQLQILQINVYNKSKFGSLLFLSSKCIVHTLSHPTTQHYGEGKSVYWAFGAQK